MSCGSCMFCEDNVFGDGAFKCHKYDADLLLHDGDLYIKSSPGWQLQYNCDGYFEGNYEEVFVKDDA